MPLHAQVFDDVGLHLGRGGSGKGHHRDVFADGVEHGADAAVFRAEVVPPFRDAVGFVDGDEGDVDLFEELDILVLGKRLGGDEKQLGLAVGNILLDQLHLGFGQR